MGRTFSKVFREKRLIITSVSKWLLWFATKIAEPLLGRFSFPFSDTPAIAKTMGLTMKMKKAFLIHIIYIFPFNRRSVSPDADKNLYTKIFYRSIYNGMPIWFCFIIFLFYACFCRHHGKPTYGKMMNTPNHLDLLHVHVLWGLF